MGQFYKQNFFQSDQIMGGIGGPEKIQNTKAMIFYFNNLKSAVV